MTESKQDSQDKAVTPPTNAPSQPATVSTPKTASAGNVVRVARPVTTDKYVMGADIITQQASVLTEHTADEVIKAAAAQGIVIIQAEEN